jgi:autotransporter-associated beta strand protein/predicted outer membrane repeat protein
MHSLIPRSIISRALACALAAPAFFALPARSQVPGNGAYEFHSNATYDGSGGSQRFAANASTTWLVADDITVTVSNNDSGNIAGGVFGAISGNRTIRIEPLYTTGRVRFVNNSVEADGGVFSIGTNSSIGILHLTNVDFLENKGTFSYLDKNNGVNSSGGGAIYFGMVAQVFLTDVLFDGNNARLGGAINGLGALTINSGVFTGNYAHGWNNIQGGILLGNALSGHGGAINMLATQMRLAIIRDTSFTGNWARRHGGAISTRARSSLEFWDLVDLSNNFSGYGGAIGDAITVTEEGEGVFLKYTGTTATTHFVYSGNMAKGSDMTAAEITAATTTGTAPFDPLAKAGGFYLSSQNNNASAKTRLFFDIATGVTVQIGEAGNPLEWDSIATVDATGDSARLDLTGAGAGRLILHADNSYFQGTVNVGAGSLLLGNQNASLGGVIMVASGATFGGSGTLVTHRQDDTVSENRTSLTLDAGANLVAGSETATGAETLHVMGDVIVGNGVTFNHDLFASGSAGKLRAENISFTGSAIINLGLLATGTFALLEWSGTGGADLSGFSLTVSGVTDSSRTDAQLFPGTNSIGVALTTINNLVMKWTGADSAAWGTIDSSRQKNWADTEGSREALFFSADRVLFDSVADAANPGNRTITLAPEGVVVSGMEVTGGARYEFQGAGGITASLNAAGNPGFARPAKLVKSGSGELVFANTGANVFQGGIDVAGGMITFSHAAQLGSGTAGIVFSDSGTLRAAGTVNGTLNERLSIAAGKTAEIKIDSGGLVYDGALSAGGPGAVLRKTGGGAMLLTSGNATGAAAVIVDAGRLTLATPTAALGGNITVISGATLDGIGSAGNGGGVTIASGGILEAGLGDAQSGTLTVHNLTVTGGAIFKFDLFTNADGAYKGSDRILEMGTTAISGTNTIDLTSFATGAFNLGNITALAASTGVTISGMALPAGGRITATLADVAGALELVMTSDQSRAMTWTGNGSATWNLANANWTDSGAVGAVNQYSYGDRVIFDGSASAASRVIFVDAGQMRVADIIVGGDADHTFTGGGIHASDGNVQQNGITGATGKLVKTGAGTLTFANGKNTFTGGVSIGGGTLVIGSGEQLTTPDTAGITFAGDATLRASADLSLHGNILIAPGVTAVLDSAGHGMTLAGALAGAADTTLAKTGVGTATLESDMTGFSGTLAVRNGVLRAGAADMLAPAANATVIVDAGATLDLDGHNQTLTKLQGMGVVGLGGARLTMDIDAAGAEFAGAFTGAGAVVKTGAGKWTLSGSSSHTGGIVFQAGEIGLAGSAALGGGALTLGAPSGLLSIDAAGLNIPGDLIAGTGTLTVATNGRAVEFSGAISGAGIVLDGAGDVTLSGYNSFAQLEVHTPLVIARRAESAAGTVVIAAGSTFEFRGVESGQVPASFTGDRVLFTDSTLTLSRASILGKLEIGAGSRITASVAGALGGADADITVRGALATAGAQDVQARNMIVDGGALVFGSTPLGSARRISPLALSGTLGFTNGGEVRLGSRLGTGIHAAVTAAGGITGTPAYNANQDGVFMIVDVVDGNQLRITAYDMALEPGKDIAAGFDAMRSSMDAVHLHLGEELLSPMVGTNVPAGEKAIWTRVIGSFGEHESTNEYLGYTDNTFAFVLGYDWISTKNFMLGACLGYTDTDLKTATDATTGIGLPILGLYGAKRWGDCYAAANLAHGFGDAKTERYEPLGGRVNGSYDLNSLAASVEAGRVFPFKSGQIRPSAGIHYTTLSLRDYKETETSAGAVRLGNIRIGIPQAVLRIDGSQEITMPRGLPGMIDVGLGLRRNLDNKRTDIEAILMEHPGTRLPIRGDKYDTNTILGRVGLRAMLTKTTLFAVSYEYNYLPYGGHRNTFIATVRQSW